MSFAPRLQLARLLWPRSLGLRCLVAILLGVALDRLLPGVAPWLAPLRVVGLQASQLVLLIGRDDPIWPTG